MLKTLSDACQLPWNQSLRWLSIVSFGFFLKSVQDMLDPFYILLQYSSSKAGLVYCGRTKHFVKLRTFHLVPRWLLSNKFLADCCPNILHAVPTNFTPCIRSPEFAWMDFTLLALNFWSISWMSCFAFPSERSHNFNMIQLKTKNFPDLNFNMIQLRVWKGTALAKEKLSTLKKFPRCKKNFLCCHNKFPQFLRAAPQNIFPQWGCPKIFLRLPQT